MKKAIKKMMKKEGGFTLVELIVVLVILALLAAILVPTLLGYIDKARDEKNFSAAQTVRVAAQSVEDSIYAANALDGNTAVNENTTTKQGSSKTIKDLAGVNFNSCSFECSNGVVGSGTVTITDGGVTKTYTWDGSTWTAGNAS